MFLPQLFIPSCTGLVMGTALQVGSGIPAWKGERDHLPPYDSKQCSLLSATINPSLSLWGLLNVYSFFLLNRKSQACLWASAEIDHFCGWLSEQKHRESNVPASNSLSICSELRWSNPWIIKQVIYELTKHAGRSSTHKCSGEVQIQRVICHLQPISVWKELRKAFGSSEEMPE